MAREEKDFDLRALAAEEVESLQQRKEELERASQRLLLPRIPWTRRT